MIGKFSIALGASLLSAAALAPVPAMAYDPCQRALADEHEAEETFWRWCGNHDSSGSCSVTGRGLQLYNQWQNAVDRRRRACA